MTVDELLAQAYPKHIDRIRDICAEQGCKRYLQLDSDSSPGDELNALFMWSGTAEGHDYWERLSEAGTDSEPEPDVSCSHWGMFCA